MTSQKQHQSQERAGLEGSLSYLIGIQHNPTDIDTPQVLYSWVGSNAYWQLNPRLGQVTQTHFAESPQEAFDQIFRRIEGEAQERGLVDYRILINVSHSPQSRDEVQR